MRYFLLFLLCIPRAWAIQLSWYGSEQTGITGQPCWVEGIGYSTISSGCANTAPVTFLIKTNATNPNIPAGSYKLWYKAHVFPQVYGQAYVTVEGGGTPISAPLGGPALEGNIWKYVGLINIPAATNQIKFTLSRTNNVHPWPHNAYAVYMNSDTNVTVISGSEAIQTWLYPTEMSTNTPIAGNLLPNSSFELPPPSGPWSIGLGASRWWSFYESLSPTDPYDGKTCLRLDFSRYGVNHTGPHVVQSRPVRLRKNMAHSFSLWAKATAASGATIQLAIKNAIPYPTGESFPAQPAYQTGNLTLTTNWARYALRNQTLLEYPYCEYYPYFSCSSPQGGKIYVDAVQLEEGPTETAYANLPFTLGFDIPAQGSLLFPSDLSGIKAIIHNNSGTNRTAIVDWNLFYRGYQLMTNGSITVNSLSGNYHTNSMPLSGLPPGFYRLTSFLRGEEQVQSEYNFSVVTQPTTSDEHPTNSVIGFHTFHYHYIQQQIKRAGLRHYRSLSPGAFFRFSTVKPNTNAFVTFDSLIRGIQQYGVEILGELQQDFSASWIYRAFITHGAVANGPFQVGETVTSSSGGTGIITWISSPSDPFPVPCMQLMNASPIANFPVGTTITGNSSGASAALFAAQDSSSGQNTVAYTKDTFALDQWRPFCSNIVAHYTTVHTWEMLNEPGGGFAHMGGDAGMKVSAVMTRDGVLGIRDVRTTDKIVILGGAQDLNYASLLWTNLPPNIKTNVHAASFHFYCTTLDGRGSEGVKWARERNLECWNTESGYEDGISLLNVSDTRHYNGYAMQPYIDSERDILKFARTPRIVSTNVVELVWAGMNRYYYYDMRHSADAVSDIYSVQGSHYSTIGIHDDFKSKMVALVFQNNILEPYGYKGMVLSNSFARTFGMVGKTNSQWLAIYTPRNTNGVMSWSLGPSQYELYSLEGASMPVTGSDVPFSNFPVFIRGLAGTTLASMSNAVVTASFSHVPDTTPPIVLFKTGPIGNVTQRRNEAGFIVSWVGYDGVSAPYSANIHALKYRAKLDDAPFSEWLETSLLPPIIFEPTSTRRRLDDEAVVFSSGPHTIYVECMDEAGNVGAGQVSFTIQ